MSTGDVNAVAVRSSNGMGDCERRSLEAWRAVLAASQHCQRLKRELRIAEAECAEGVREYRAVKSPIDSEVSGAGATAGNEEPKSVTRQRSLD